MEYEWQTITLLMSVSASHSLTQKNRRVIVYMECVYRKYSDLRKIEKESAHYPLFRPLQWFTCCQLYFCKFNIL